MSSEIKISKKNSINEDNFIYSKKKEENINQYSLNKINCIKNIEEFKNKNNQKDQILIQSFSLNDRKKSSDSTSMSFSQTENLSQLSEPSSLISNTNNFQKIYSNEIIQKDLIKEEEMNFFYGIENYFLKIMPEKFSEYKKTKNYLPKKKLKETEKDNEKQIEQKDNENSISENDVNMEENKFNQNLNLQMNNNLYYPTYGNIFYYTYNTFCFNCPFTNIINNENNQIRKKEKGKEEEKDTDINIETNINNKIDQNKNINKEKDFYKYNDEHIINEDVYEYEDVYLIKIQKNYKTYNKNKNKEKKQTNNFEKIDQDCNYNKKNMNCKFKYNNSNNQIYNNYNKNNSNQNIYHNYYKTYNYNKESYYNISENNNNDKRNNYYNKKNYIKKKHCKIIYY